MTDYAFLTKDSWRIEASGRDVVSAFKKAEVLARKNSKELTGVFTTYYKKTGLDTGWRGSEKLRAYLQKKGVGSK